MRIEQWTVLALIFMKKRVFTSYSSTWSLAYSQAQDVLIMIKWFRSGSGELAQHVDCPFEIVICWKLFCNKLNGISWPKVGLQNCCITVSIGKSNGLVTGCIKFNGTSSWMPRWANLDIKWVGEDFLRSRNARKLKVMTRVYRDLMKLTITKFLF